MRGALATMGSQLVRLVFQFLGIVIVSRMLAPSDFGIFAMVTPVIGFSMMFQDFGLTQALVTAPRLLQDEAAAIFRINVLLSVGVAVVLCLLAPLLSHFYGEPAVAAITMAMAVQIVMVSATAAHMALLTRGMKFDHIALIEIASTLAGFGSLVGVAWAYRSPWALVAQGYGTSLTALGMAWGFTRWKPTHPAPLATIGGSLRFGAAMTGFNLANYVSRNADNVLIGWARGAVELGLYDRGYKLLLFPLQQVNGPVQNVMVPLLSRIVGEPDRYRAAYMRTMRLLLMVTMPGVLFLIVAAPEIILTLLGRNWTPAVPIFQWLGLAGVHQTFSSTFGWLMVSQRRAGEYARYSVAAMFSCLVSFAAGLSWGAVGVAAGYGISGLAFRLPALLWLAGRRGPVSSVMILRMIAPYSAALGATAAVWALLAPVIRTLPPYGLLVAGVATIYAVFWTAMLCSAAGQAVLREAIDLSRSILSR